MSHLFWGVILTFCYCAISDINGFRTPTSKKKHLNPLLTDTLISLFPRTYILIPLCNVWREDNFIGIVTRIFLVIEVFLCR